MMCPNCGNVCEEWHLFCPHCGAALIHKTEDAPAEDLPAEDLPAQELPAQELPAEETPAEPQEISTVYQDYLSPQERRAAFEPPKVQKKGAMWPPIILMAVMLCAGIAVFFLTGGNQKSSDTPWFQIENGVLYFDESKYTGGPELTVPETVNGEWVLALGDKCFYDCDSLTTVFLPDSLQIIGDSAFADCDAIRGILIPESVNQIGAAAFQGCDGLEAICVPYTVKSIGSNAFYGCFALEHIFYPGPKASWKALYSDPIGRSTYVYCADGTYQQGGVS